MNTETIRAIQAEFDGYENTALAALADDSLSQEAKNAVVDQYAENLKTWLSGVDALNSDETKYLLKRIEAAGALVEQLQTIERRLMGKLMGMMFKRAMQGADRRDENPFESPRGGSPLDDFFNDFPSHRR